MSTFLPFLRQAEDIAKGKVSQTSLPNSVLNRQQADTFMDLVVDYSTLMKMVTVKRVNHSSGSVPKWDLDTYVTQGATTTSTVTHRSPSESVMTYDMEKYRSGFFIDSDFLEDNIEGDAARNTLLDMMRKRIAVNMEYAALMSDDSLATGDGQSDENNLLGVNDGWYKILLNAVPTAQLIDAAGTSSSAELYYEMKRRVPAKFRVAKPNYRFLMGSAAYDRLALTQYARVTAAGDDAIRTGEFPGTWGTPAVEIPGIPETQTVSATGATDGTFIILTDPKNLVVFLRREWKIEYDRKPALDGWEMVMHHRADFQVIDPTAVIMAYNVSDSGTAYDRDA